MKKVNTTAHNHIASISLRGALCTLWFIFFSFFIFEYKTYASINEAFTYQGKIVNTDGTNLTSSEASCISGGADTCDFRVSLYTASSGGTLVWQETKSDVEIEDNDGIFNLTLDCSGTFSSCNQNGGPDFTSGNLFINVEFDPSGNADFAEGETFSPRRELTAVPYAFNALTADSIDGVNTNSTEFGYLDGATVEDGGIVFGNSTNFTQDITSLYWDASLNRLGVGTSAPSATLDLVGDLEANGAITVTSTLDLEGYGAIGNGSALSADSGLIVDYDATFTGIGEQLLLAGTVTGANSTNVYGARIAPESITISSGTTNLAASVYVGETNITEVGTLTNSASVYIAGAATEADNNYALWVDAGAVQIDETLDVLGAFTSAEDWTWDASTPTLNFGAGEVLAMTDGTDAFTIDATGSSMSFSDGTNSFTFDADSGPSYAGTARPTRQITLSPEFAGAVLTGDGTNNTGTMLSDFCENGASADIPNTNTSVCSTSGDIHNYYSWTTGAGTAQDYDIWIRWRVPDNFSAWAAADPVTVWGKRTDATNNAINIYVYDTAGTLENAGGTQVAGTSWTETSVESSFAGTYTAGEYVTFRISLTADTGGDSVQLGEISLDYLSNN